MEYPLLSFTICMNEVCMDISWKTGFQTSKIANILPKITEYKNIDQRKHANNRTIIKTFYFTKKYRREFIIGISFKIIFTVMNG